MTKVDFKKEFKHLYNPPKGKFTVVEVPSMQYLMIDGMGDPNTSLEYQQAIEALYALAYKIKFVSKKVLDRDYVVPPLEGLWGSTHMESLLASAEGIQHWLDLFSSSDRDMWQWTMMIMQPDWIVQDVYRDSYDQVIKTKDLPALEGIRLESYDEGISVQTMYIGSYADEGPTLAEMHLEYLPENGYKESGKHHEIYISDPRKVSPDKQKTVLRQPIKKM